MKGFFEPSVVLLESPTRQPSEIWDQRRLNGKTLIYWKVGVYGAGTGA